MIHWRSDSNSKESDNTLYDSGFAIFDNVFDDIVESIGARLPESGGALLGLNSGLTVVRFIFDDMGATTGTSYTPSPNLTEVVQRVEIHDHLQFKGVVHSHPGALDQPSGPDVESFRLGLEANPELARYLAPIITFEPGRPNRNKLEIGRGVWASFYVAMLTRDRRVRVSPCLPRVVYFARDCRELAKHLGVEDPVVGRNQFEDHYHATTEISLPDGRALFLAASDGYPVVAPFALLADRSSSLSEQIFLRWQYKNLYEKPLINSVDQLLRVNHPRQVGSVSDPDMVIGHGFEWGGSCGFYGSDDY